MPKQATPYAFHREDLTQRSLYIQKLFHRDRETFTHRKLLHAASFYIQQAFTHRSAFGQTLLHSEAFTISELLHTQALHREAFTQQALTHSKLSHKEAPTQKSLYTEKLLHTKTFTQRSLYPAFAHSKPLRSFYTQQAFTQRSSYTEKLLHRETFTHTHTHTHCQLLHRKAFAHRSFYTQRAFTQRSPYTEKLPRTEAFTHSELSHREAFTHRSFYTIIHSKLLHRKTFTLRKLCAEQAFTQTRFYTQQAFQLRKSADKAQPDAATLIPFTIFQLQKTLVLRTQSRRSHYNVICRDWVAKHNEMGNERREKLQLQNWISAPKKRKDY